MRHRGWLRTIIRRAAAATGGRTWRVVFALVAASSVVILFAPESNVPSAIEGMDKVVHISLFAALSGSGVFAGIRRRGLAAGLVAYALASEVIQASPVLGRSSSGWDVLADLVGIAAGMAAAAAAARDLRGTQ